MCAESNGCGRIWNPMSSIRFGNREGKIEIVGPWIIFHRNELLISLRRLFYTIRRRCSFPFRNLHSRELGSTCLFSNRVETTCRILRSNIHIRVSVHT